MIGIVIIILSFSRKDFMGKVIGGSLDSYICELPGIILDSGNIQKLKQMTYEYIKNIRRQTFKIQKDKAVLTYECNWAQNYSL